VVLAAVARDLRRGFGERYRVMRAPSGADALEILRQLRTRGDQVALLIADQRMPVMAGTDFLVQARTLVPDAKRVLLTAYDYSEGYYNRAERQFYGFAQRTSTIYGCNLTMLGDKGWRAYSWSMWTRRTAARLATHAVIVNRPTEKARASSNARPVPTRLMPM
jgi:hypothetical protein